MMRYQTADLPVRTVIPVTAYLLTGLLFIKFYDSPYGTYFVLWGIMAGMILGLKEYFSDKMVTVGIGVYSVVAIVCFGVFLGDENRIHAFLAVSGIAAVWIFHKIFCCQAVKVLYGYAGLILLICCEFAGIHFSKGIIALAVVLFLNSVSETIALFYHENSDSFIIIFVIVAVLTFVTPVSQNPHDWGFVKKAASAVSEFFGNIAAEIQYQWGYLESNGIFHYGYTAYSDSAFSLSKSIVDTDIEQLMLHGNRTKRNFYLKGNVCDSFHGSGWDTSINEETIPAYTDTLMTLYAVFSHTQDIEVLQKFMNVHEQELTLLNIKTQSIFYPLKSLRIMADNLEQEGDNIRAGKMNGRGYTYSYQFVDLDYASPELIDIIEDSENITYDEETYCLMFEKMKEYYKMELEQMPFSVFAAKTQEGRTAVSKQYTVLDDAVSEQVRVLAYTVTADCVGDYEKAKALERYLYQYHYSKAIDVPQGVNILDWFLFDGQEGYCAHYATALAAMLRCVGIPSRIAEGFLVDYTDYADFTHYTISGSKAHVWVEAYIEGFGWIRLEPTVVNAANANLVWYTDSEPEGAEEDEEEFSESLPEKEEEADLEESEESIWMMMLVLLLGMAVIVAGILLLLMLHRRNSLRKSGDPDVILRHLLSLLGKTVSPKEEGETLAEYFARISCDGRIPEEMKDRLGAVLERMERYWYGDGRISAEEVQELRDVRDLFLKGCIKKST